MEDAPEFSEESFQNIEEQADFATSPDDAPEQIVDADDDIQEDGYGAGKNLQVPNSHAALAADSLIGVTNNALEMGGNFFVKIKKSKEIMQFKKARKIIDKQNKKNIDRLKLDSEDKALLKPILMEVLKKRAKELTPEQQLIAAFTSILAKRIPLAIEMRAEGKMLEQNLRNAVREEIAARSEKKDKKQEEDEQLEVVEVESTEIGKAA